MRGLSLQNLAAGYNHTLVFTDLSLAVKPKETLVIMGPSGSGKSTLLLTILGIILPQRGKIFLNEKEITSLPIEERHIGYLPQDYGLFPHLTVIDNISYGLRIRGLPSEAPARKMLSLVQLEGYEKHKIQELSGGQRQRVGLARAIAIAPDLLLLDEPLSNIDQVTKAEVAMQMKELFKKLDIPIMVITHNHEDAFFLAQHLAMMIEGKIEQTGTIQDVVKHPKTTFIKKLLMPFAQTL